MESVAQTAFPWVVWFIAVLIAFQGVLMIVAYTVLAERKVLGWIQGRIGPNRVGPFGLLQVVADGVKIFMKEDWVPPFADKAVFVIAPAVIIVSAPMIPSA